ncbi:MAG TPA: hypothetical protein VNB49_01125 [Candidatus Dormibacteraeota bacterium]|nr:hypothetical protein [Candidatus Dormibacteraeota bacterium]
MEVRLTPEQEVLIRQAIESGPFRDPEEAVQDSVSLWEGHERKRADFLASLDEAGVALTRVVRTSLSGDSRCGSLQRR